MGKRIIRSVGCFIHDGDDILILRRSKHEAVPGVWGLPGGGIDEGESPQETILREIHEEIGSEFSPHDLEFVGHWHCHLSDCIADIHLFRTHLQEPIEVTLDPMEHDDFRWISPQNYFEMQDIMPGNHELLQRAGYVQRKEPYVESRPPS